MCASNGEKNTTVLFLMVIPNTLGFTYFILNHKFLPFLEVLKTSKQIMQKNSLYYNFFTMIIELNMGSHILTPMNKMESLNISTAT